VTAAAWIQRLVDGLIGRVTFDPDFDPREQVPVLKLILTRFLRP
jgi:TetR/AcrR family transcriptional regulator, repressor for uid operon